ncbi:MAG: AbrB family transcriptional regulator [Rhodospirillales bacterium]
MSDAAQKSPLKDPALWRAWLLTVVIGAAGGWLFAWFSMPLGWMTGSMVFTTIAAVSGLRMEFPRPLRNGLIVILGLMIGSTFTPETLKHALGWWPTLLGVVVFSTLATAGVMFYLKRTGKFRPSTAYFSAAPGGFGEMVIIAESYGANVPRVALVHTTRIFIVVLLLPLWFRIFEGYVPPDIITTQIGGDLHIKDILILLAAGIVGYFGAKMLRIPAPQMTGAMIASITVHVLGFTDAAPPGYLIAAAQLALGCSVGAKFTGITRKTVVETVGHGIVATCLIIVIAILIAWALDGWTDYPMITLFLAFAPGGFAEMSLISLTLGIETAFVSTHHLARLLFVVLATPLFFRFFRKLIEQTPKAGPGPSS